MGHARMAGSGISSIGSLVGVFLDSGSGGELVRRRVVREGMAASCYFRSSVEPPYRKSLVQITERCNLRCAHCFVSAGNRGYTLPLDRIRDALIPAIREWRTVSVTLTGGEPFMHPDLVVIVRLLREAGMGVGICTNGALVSPERVRELAAIGGVHVNVSLDGFRPESHGRFRGDPSSFRRTVDAINLLSDHGLLQGLLVTPNNLATVEEYAELCDFALRQRAKYVLLNPLSRMGRGVASIGSLRASDETMERIREETARFAGRMEVVYIRFPNRGLPLGPCEAGRIVYVFSRGEVAICPYLVFASRTPGSQYRPDQFIVGNVFTHRDIADRLERYDFLERSRRAGDPRCLPCHLASGCGRGCPAAVVARGGRLGEADGELCPVTGAG